ncbi:MAG: putative addiction module antidote protein [Termitinemataceae bacterium]|nr:MAG: putative addiction module antidote protein [Termitinemataceae bacterium]
MKKITISDYDSADYINTKEDVAVFLAGAVEENDLEFIIKRIGDISRSRGMAQIAKELKLDRAGLYRSFSKEGNPSFKTVFNLLNVLGLRIKLEPKSAM